MVIDFREKDIIWTASEFTKDELTKSEFPYIEMTEYQMNFSATIQESIAYWTRIKESVVHGDLRQIAEPYANLYTGDQTGFYVLPFFSDEHHEISQSWEESETFLGQYMNPIKEGIAKYSGLVVPAAGSITPKSYTGSAENNVSFSFFLINTGPNSITDIKKNQAFLDQFILKNLHNQNNALIVTPPSIYKVNIPGVRYMPVCVVSSLGVKNIGTLNIMNNRIIPDIWQVTVRLKELVFESRNLYEQAMLHGTNTDGMTIKVINRSAVGNGLTEFTKVVSK